MQEENVLDSPSNDQRRKFALSNKLFFLSIVSTVMGLCISSTRSVLALPHRSMLIVLLILNIIALSAVIVGFVIGFKERRKKKRWALFGIIANGILLLIYIIFVIRIVIVVSAYAHRM